MDGSRIKAAHGLNKADLPNGLQSKIADNDNFTPK